MAGVLESQVRWNRQPATEEEILAKTGNALQKTLRIYSGEGTAWTRIVTVPETVAKVLDQLDVAFAIKMGLQASRFGDKGTNIFMLSEYAEKERQKSGKEEGGVVVDESENTFPSILARLFSGIALHYKHQTPPSTMAVDIEVGVAKPPAENISEAIRQMKLTWQDGVATQQGTAEPSRSRRGRRLKRETVEKLLAGLIQRAAEMNAEPYHTGVKRLTLFGSALDENARPGDIDILVDWHIRTPELKGDAYLDYVESYWDESDEVDLTRLDGWCTRQAVRDLRGGHQSYSLQWGHEWEKLVAKVPHKVIFEDLRTPTEDEVEMF